VCALLFAGVHFHKVATINFMLLAISHAWFAETWSNSTNQGNNGWNQ
jgi:hypothetical protein